MYQKCDVLNISSVSLYYQYVANGELVQFVHKCFNVCMEEGVFVYVGIHVNKGHVKAMKLVDFGLKYN